MAACAAPCLEEGEKEVQYVNADVSSIYTRWDSVVPPLQYPKIEAMLRAMHAEPPASERDYQKLLSRLRKVYKVVPRKAQLLFVYQRLVAAGALEAVPQLREVLVTKASKSQSGIISITVLTSPYPRVGDTVQPFSCQWNCHYCPDQPGQPRSYLREEPAVRRANQNRFDPVLQFTDRAAVLAQNGHPVDKVELLVLGGTWASYPPEYQEDFVRDLFYAANVFFQRPGEGRRRERLSMAEEQRVNETSAVKIIGLTLETRPDCINVAELRRLRFYGCTRVQIGLQHTDDAVLKKVNRGHSCAAAARALRHLKNACFKVDVHLMPNLPGSTPGKDAAMLRRMLEDPELQADQWKIYPTEVTPWTRIKEWFDEGSYVPYGEDELIRVIADCKAKVHPWIRLNRIIRDIPSNYIKAGLDAPNLREAVLAELGNRGLRCHCIRCREVGDMGGRGHRGASAGVQGTKWRDARSTHRVALELASEARLKIRTYAAQDATEHFLSYEVPAPSLALCGFLRLRIGADAGLCRKRVTLNEDADEITEEVDTTAAEARDAVATPEEAKGDEVAFPELRGAALVRELHVYGQLSAAIIDAAGHTHEDDSLRNAANRAPDPSPQHMGFGRRLVLKAEEIAWQSGLRKVAIIAGVGTREYYRKLGYTLGPADGYFLLKVLDGPPTALGHQAAGSEAAGRTHEARTRKRSREESDEQAEQPAHARKRTRGWLRRAMDGLGVLFGWRSAGETPS